MVKVLRYLFSTRSIPIIICTSLMLFFLGVYFLIAFKSNALVDQIKNESIILIELTSDISPDEKLIVETFLKQEQSIVVSSLEYISRNEAKLIMENELGISFNELADENPFFDVYQFNIENKSTDSKILLAEIKLLAGVHNAYVQESYAEEIGTNVRRFSILALIVGIFFSSLAITLIYNAIKLSLVESKSSFYTLKLLGADWNFIKKPFLQRAFYSGLLSGVIAILLFLVVISYLALSSRLLSSMISPGNIIMVIFMMLAVGFFVNIISTNTILNRYLAMKEEDLYN